MLPRQKPVRGLIRQLQLREARLAVGPSTVRGQPSGTAAKARQALLAVKLGPFGTRDHAAFCRALDRETSRVRRALPQPSWGLARKILNIFLRGCLYNVYVRDHYHLDRAEAWYEVPLDQLVATNLERLCREGEVPTWYTVKALEAQASAEYQRAAERLASARRIARVHLDAFLWLDRDAR
jgi:hypothetical protein